MNVLLLTRYDSLGASSRLRAYQYVSGLRSRGIDVRAAPLLSNDYLERLYSARRPRLGGIFKAYARRVARLRTERDYDLLWLEYEMLPWIPYWLERLLVGVKPPFVVELDDAVFHRYDRHSNPIVRLLLSRKIDRVMRGAALVIAGNEYVAARARRAGARRVEIVPTVVDLDRYRPAPSAPPAPFTVGWIGTPATAPALQSIRPALEELQRMLPLRVVLIGSGPVDLGSVQPSIVPWSEDTEAAQIAQLHVGLMPLPDTDWNRGKSGYKLIQYMASGLPVVASPVGVNTQLVEPEVNGLLATAPDEWKRALARLAADPELRARLGRAGRRRVEERYSLQVMAPRVESLLRVAAGGV